MTLPENYKFIFVDWRKETPVFVRKEDGTDVAVISYNNEGTYVDVNTFAFMYSDGEHIFGRVPEGEDVNLLFKTSEGVLILGKEIEVPEVSKEEVAEQPEEVKEEVTEEATEEVNK